MTGITWAEWRALINTAVLLAMLAVGFIAYRQHPNLLPGYLGGLAEWRQGAQQQLTPATEPAPPFASPLLPSLNLRRPNELAAVEVLHD